MCKSAEHTHCKETLPDADFTLYPLQMKSGKSLNQLQQKEKNPVLTLTFILLCFPVSPSPEEEEEEDVPSPVSGSGSSGGSGWKPAEGKLSLCHLLLAGSPRKAALGTGGAHYVAEFPPGSHWAAAGDVQDTQTPLQGLPALLRTENPGQQGWTMKEIGFGSIFAAAIFYYWFVVCGDLFVCFGCCF